MANKTLIGLLAAAGMMASASAHAIIIDTFNTTPQIVNTLAPNSNLASPSSLGGWRNLTFIAASPDNGSGSVVVGGPVGAMTVATGTNFPQGGEFTQITVGWDANGAGLGGVDLTDGGVALGIEIELVDIDVGSVDFSFEIRDTLNNMLTLGVTGVSAVGSVFMSYIGLTPAELAILTDVNSILATVTTQGRADIVVDFVGTRVPEPASLGILGAGLIGLGMVARRRRRS